MGDEPPLFPELGFDEGYTLPTNALRSKLFGVTIAYARPSTMADAAVAAPVHNPDEEDT